MSPSDELNQYLAHTQGRLVFFLLIVLVLLVFGVMAILLIPRITVNTAVINLLVQVITGVLALAGTGCGFFFARTRTGGLPDSAPMITQTVTTPDGAKASITSPAHLPIPPNPTLPATAAAGPGTQK